MPLFYYTPNLTLGNRIYIYFNSEITKLISEFFISTVRYY